MAAEADALVDATLCAAADEAGQREQDGALNKAHCVRLVRDLLADGQRHVFDGWPSTRCAPGAANDEEEDDEDEGESSGKKKKENSCAAAEAARRSRRQLLTQLCRLDTSYGGVGGLLGYVRNARRLLEQSRAGVNPLAGWTPSVPSGDVCMFPTAASVLSPSCARFMEQQERGMHEARRCAFVLVAGGLGERLGFSGIKLKLPCESVTRRSFLRLYIESILAIQRRRAAADGESGACAAVPLPLAIMTSDDTHVATETYLRENAFFGMDESSVTLMKQEKVACLGDNDARLAMRPGSQMEILTKPHGHGDVHALLHASGLLRRWIDSGLEWVCFFQDTNALVFNTVPLALCVSAERAFEVNSIAVPRKAKEAIGGIARLRNACGEEMTLNLEYNQLDPILRATVNPEGDVNDPDTGFSPFPGNINQLILHLGAYERRLASTGGAIAEFVNPKYFDPASKDEFKSPTRLECMMQDYPCSLPSSSRVGFTVSDVWFSYSPVKNSPADALSKHRAGTPSHSATEAELDVYRANARLLELIGVTLGRPRRAVFNGIGVDVYPRIVWDPDFAMTITDLRRRFPFAERVSIAADSTLVLKGADITVESLQLDGCLVIDARCVGAHVTVRGLRVENDGWQLEPTATTTFEHAATTVQEDPSCEIDRLRGFTLSRRGGRHVVIDCPGEHILDT